MKVHKLARVLTAAVLSGSLALAVPSVSTAKKRHCVHYKTYKKHHHTYKRCSKYA